MFGGLEIKSPGSQQQEANEDTTVPSQPRENGLDIVGSAFSFLGNVDESESKVETNDVKTNESNTSSVFSFLSSAVPVAAPPAQSAATPSEPAPVAAVAQPSTVKAVSTGIEIGGMLSVPDDATGNSSLPSSSGFSFLSEQQPSPEPKSEPDLLSLQAPIAGAGITFESTASKKPIKKKSRSKKVGMMASSSSPAPLPPPIPPTYGRPLEAPVVKPSSSKEEAEEALRKADQFLNEKALQDLAEKEEREREEREKAVSPTVALAEAAAEEAKAMTTTNKKGFGSGIHITNFLNRSRVKIPFFSDKDTSNDDKDSSKGDKDSSKGSLHDTRGSFHDTRGSFHDTKDSSSSRPSSYRGIQPPEELPKPEPEPEQETPEEQAAKAATAEEIHRLEKLKQDQQQLQLQNEEQERLELETKQTLTPEQIFDSHIHRFRDSVQTATRQLSQLRSDRAQLTIQKSSAEKGQLLATQQITQALEQQSQAAEAEDYDLADRLAQIMQRHEMEKREQKQILDKISEAIGTLDRQREELAVEIKDYFREIRAKLMEFHTEQECAEKEDGSEALKVFESTSKRLSAEHDRLNHELKHIQRDENIVAEERKELEAAIENQCKDVIEEKTQVTVKLEAIQMDIDDLKRQLAMKEMEAEALSNQLEAHNETIEKSRSKFSRQLNRLAKKETSVTENRNEWEAEKKALSLMKEMHEKEVEAHSEALLRYENLIGCVLGEVETAERLEQVIEHIVVGKDESEKNEEVMELQGNVVKFEAAVDEAENVLMAANETMERLKEEIEKIDARIPILEKEKKAAAAKREFKVAGRKSKEIKEVTARRERCREELEGEAMERLDAAKKERERAGEILEDKRAVLQEMEETQAVEQMEHIANKIQKLKKTREDVCGEFVKLHKDVGVCVASVGASVLGDEIKALITEGQALGQKYGKWDDILASLQEQTKDDEEPETTASDEQQIEEETKSTDGLEKVNGKEANPTEDENENTSLTEDQSSSEKEEETPTSDASPEKEEETENDNEQAILKWKELTKSLKAAEASLDQAVEEENYDRAEEIDDELKQLSTEIENLGLSDEILKSLAAAEEDKDDKNKEEEDNDDKNKEEEDKDDE